MVALNTGNDLAARLGRHVVEKVAPEEAVLFDETWPVIWARPGKRGKPREEPLGFGVPEVGEVLVTAVTAGVVLTVLQELGKDFGQGLTTRGKLLLSRLRRRVPRTLPRPLPPPSQERLREIHSIAYARARKLGLVEAKAEALADALVSELARGQETS